MCTLNHCLNVQIYWNCQTEYEDQIEYEKLLSMYDYDAGNLPLSFNNIYAYNDEN